MRCSDIMKRDVKCVTIGETVKDTADRMRRFRVGFLPVCDTSGKVVGVVTDRDLAVRVVAHAESVYQPIEKVMTLDVLSCRPLDAVRRAVELMARRRASRIVCVDGEERPVGVISLSDIAALEDGTMALAMLRVVSRKDATA